MIHAQLYEEVVVRLPLIGIEDYLRFGLVGFSNASPPFLRVIQFPQNCLQQSLTGGLRMLDLFTVRACPQLAFRALYRLLVRLSNDMGWAVVIGRRLYPCLACMAVRAVHERNLLLRSDRPEVLGGVGSNGIGDEGDLDLGEAHYARHRLAMVPDGIPQGISKAVDMIQCLTL